MEAKFDLCDDVTRTIIHMTKLFDASESYDDLEMNYDYICGMLGMARVLGHIDPHEVPSRGSSGLEARLQAHLNKRYWVNLQRILGEVTEA